MKAWLILGLSILTASASFANEKQDVKDIKQILQRYNDATEKQDVELMAAILPAKSMHYIPSQRFPDGLAAMSGLEYKEMLAAKKIGGKKRAVKIHSIDFDAVHTNAIVRVDFSNEIVIFHAFVGLSKVKSEWRIMSILIGTEMVAKK